MWTTAGPLRAGEAAIPLWRWAFATITRAPCLWTTLWKSQECPLRAAFRCRRPGGRATFDAVASAPLAPSARRRSTPACAVDARRYARRRSSTPDLLWTAVADRIRDDLSPMVFGAWFSTTRALALEGDVLEVGVPNEFTRAWIEGHFAELVRTRGHAPPTRASRCASCVADGEPARASSRASGRARRRAAPGRSAASAPASRAGRAPALEVHVRLVRDRQVQPLRARRGARRRRGARAGLQPARDLRRDRARQDAPAAGDRALRAHARARHAGSLHDLRGVHERVHRRASRTSGWTTSSGATARSSTSS